MTNSRTESKNFLVICMYFGGLSSGALFSLKTLLRNNVDVLLVTDGDVVKSSDGNLTQISTNLDLFKKNVSDRLGVKNDFKSFYKLTDFKIFYKLLLDDKITHKYKYYGFCDLDVCFGNLDQWLMESLLRDVDIIGNRGHLMFFKESYIEDLYLRLIPDSLVVFPVNKILSANKCFAFDEFKFIHKMIESDIKKHGKTLDIEISAKAIDLDYYKYNYFCLNRGMAVKELDYDGESLSAKFSSEIEIIPYAHYQKRKMPQSQEQVYYAAQLNHSLVFSILFKFKAITRRVITKFKMESLIRKYIFSFLFYRRFKL